MRLVDFQISVGPAGLTADQRKAINERLFPIYEAIRLWLRERKVTAPFRKILVSLSDRRVSERWHATATVALGICEVLEAIDIDLLAAPPDHGWTCRHVLDALQRIASQVGWRCPELESFVGQVGTRTPPCSHRFARLRKQARTGTVCDVVLEADVGITTVKVAFSVDARHLSESLVASTAGPLFIEDDFPVSATSVKNGHFVLLASDKRVLAQVTIPPRALPPTSSEE